MSAAPVEAPAEETPVEAPATEEAPAEAPVEETPAEAPAEAPAEGEPKPEEKPAEAKAPEFTEEQLQAAARKYANGTMAAARRAEARTEAVKAQNETLKRENGVYSEFVESFKTDPVGAIRRVGFPSLRAFLEHCQSAGETPAPDEGATFRNEFLTWKQQQERQAAEAAIEKARVDVFAKVDGDKTRWHYTSTARGHEDLWEAIETYYEMHGEISPRAVDYLADEVERDFRATFGEPSSAPRSGDKKSATPAAAAAPAGRKSGTTLANGSTAGTPAKREYSLDPEERRRQINEELKREGLLEIRS